MGGKLLVKWWKDSNLRPMGFDPFRFHVLSFLLLDYRESSKFGQDGTLTTELHHFIKSSLRKQVIDHIYLLRSYRVRFLYYHSYTLVTSFGFAPSKPTNSRVCISLCFQNLLHKKALTISTSPSIVFSPLATRVNKLKILKRLTAYMREL